MSAKKKYAESHPQITFRLSAEDYAVLTKYTDSPNTFVKNLVEGFIHDKGTEETINQIIAKKDAEIQKLKEINNKLLEQ